MTPEQNIEARNQFLRGAPLLMSYINPARISGSDGERSAFGLLFNTKLREAESQVRNEWLFPITVALRTAAEERGLVEGRQSIFTAGQQKLTKELRTLFLIGWQNGRASTAFTPDILHLFNIMGYIKHQSDRVEEEALEELMREAIVTGANSRAEFGSNHRRPYMTDLAATMQDAERRLDAPEPDTDTPRD